MGYMLIYFTLGRLPWQGLKARTKQEKYDKIGTKKRDTPIETLCKNQPSTYYQAGSACGCYMMFFFRRVLIFGVYLRALFFALQHSNSTEEFAVYMNYCRNLKFEEKPDYAYLRGLFEKLLKKKGWKNDNIFDWMLVCGMCWWFI